MDVTITTTRAGRVRRLAGLGLAVGLTVALGACGDDDDDDAATAEEGTEETTTTAGGGASDPYGGGGGDESGEGGSGGGAAGDVAYDVTELSYADVTAPAGGTIAIENTSGAPHTFTADDGSFDVPYGADEGATVDVPAEAGEYPFHCEVHSSMAATLTVE